MGIDWEEILDAEDECLESAYMDNIERYFCSLLHCNDDLYQGKRDPDDDGLFCYDELDEGFFDNNGDENTETDTK